MPRIVRHLRRAAAISRPWRPRTKCLDCAPGAVLRRPPATSLRGPPRRLGRWPALWCELEAAGRLDTSAGLAAVVLAQRIAAGEDTGAGIAAMVKQLGATMADALRGVAVEGDPLDELRYPPRRRRQPRPPML